MKRFLLNIGFKCLFWMIYALGLLPWWVLRIIAHGFSGIIFMTYRRGIVRANIAKAFPDRGGREIASLTRKFYTQLGYFFVEMVKMRTISKEAMARRCTLPSLEPFLTPLGQGKNVLIFYAHMGNWEWGLGAIEHELLRRHADINHASHVVFTVSNDPNAKRLLKLLRDDVHPSTTFYPSIPSMLRGIKHIPRVLSAIAMDQVPGTGHYHVANFFGKRACFSPNMERLPRLLDAPAIYTSCNRIGLGRFEVTLTPISSPPYEPESVPATPPQESPTITQRYADLLAENITRTPTQWLWTHRRWKRSPDPVSHN